MKLYYNEKFLLTMKPFKTNMEELTFLLRQYRSVKIPFSEKTAGEVEIDWRLYSSRTNHLVVTPHALTSEEQFLERFLPLGKLNVIYSSFDCWFKKGFWFVPHIEDSEKMRIECD